ncbi:heterokaryon incompatibility, partial [Lentithecium fluviatile CBS 122367]
SPYYEALSYVWGTPNCTRSMQCSKRAVPLTPNFEEALLHLRLPDRPRNVWADAVCINQKDLKERGRQVRLMGEVYRKALQVLVWLGP